jgi:hypothetical protein
MQKSYFIYQKPECNVTINKVPIWFKEVEFKGDENKGTIKFHSHNDYDEIWGSNAKMEFDWFKKDRIKFFHAREVQESIDLYNAISIVVTKKDREWLNTHEFTYWFGNRTKIIRKRYYPENAIHGVFYCEISERQFNMHSAIIRNHYEGFKPYILECYNSIVCH